MPPPRWHGQNEWDYPQQDNRDSSLDQEDDGDFLGIPNPPNSAANGCLEADFCGAAEAASASSTLRTEAGDGSYGFRKKSSTGCAR
jgi:hypothetical protein